MPRNGDNAVRQSAFASEKNNSFAKNLMSRNGDKESKGVALRNHFVAASGEFVGTVLFLFFAFAWHITVSRQANPADGPNNATSAEVVLYVGLGYGFSLLVCAWSFYRISGGLFNPAVVLGMVLSGSLPPVRGLFLIPAEILGAIAAAGLAQGLIPGKGIGLTNTLLSTGAVTTTVVQGLFLEMFLTSILIFTILMLAAEKSKVTFMAPLGIGLALFIAELAGVFYTGGSLNPARSFGPAVVSGHFPHYHWIYWIGPFLGSLITAGYYRFVKYLNYEEANEGQDDADGEFKS